MQILSYFFDVLTSIFSMVREKHARSDEGGLYNKIMATFLCFTPSTSQTITSSSGSSSGFLHDFMFLLIASITPPPRLPGLVQLLSLR